MVPMVGVGPTTLSLEATCAIQLRHTGMKTGYVFLDGCSATELQCQLAPAMMGLEPTTRCLYFCMLNVTLERKTE